MNTTLNKKTLLVLFGLILCHATQGMEPTFRKKKQERRTAQLKSYTKQDIEKLIQPLSTIVAGTVIASIGYTVQEPVMIGFGLGLVVGGTDDMSHYCKYERRYNQKKSQ